MNGAVVTIVQSETSTNVDGLALLILGAGAGANIMIGYDAVDLVDETGRERAPLTGEDRSSPI
ncbi:hypothetical protein VO57_008940 [Citromicrobium bathyomarinum]|nr:hypothetical protein [Citromicrobium sp. JL2201]KPM22245.1 hypothetical protein VO57_12395 [Citromicrobium sp. JL2201]